ncbi:MAG TPA: hypothetical protein VGH80_05490 [Xanthomonadaceae bacterium]|jgi:hypothetical protein
MRIVAALSASLMLAACSHIPLVSRQPVAGTVVGVVEFDTGLTKFSTVTGTYHQDMCSKANGDVAVHLSDREMKAILAKADKGAFYKVSGDLTTNWPDPPGKPPHCAAFRLRIESGANHNEVSWDCGADGSNTPPPQVAPLVELVQKTLRSRGEVQALQWSSCPVR